MKSSTTPSAPWVTSTSGSDTIGVSVTNPFPDGPFGAKAEETLLRSIERGCPFGAEVWQAETAARLGRESAFWPRGRPRKEPKNGS
jgi:hypothetical protein